MKTTPTTRKRTKRHDGRRDITRDDEQQKNITAVRLPLPVSSQRCTGAEGGRRRVKAGPARRDTGAAPNTARTWPSRKWWVWKYPGAFNGLVDVILPVESYDPRLQSRVF